MPTFTEFKCCVIIHDAFDTLMLNKSVLQVAFIKQHRYKSSFIQVKEMTLKLAIFFVTTISSFLT